jgi:hypothetical protein
MFRDLYRSRPHLGMIYVAMKSLRSIKLLWWKLPHAPARGSDERITANEVPAAEASICPACARPRRLCEERGANSADHRGAVPTGF